MKNRKWMQVFASIVSVILLCTFLVGFAAPITAYAADDGSGDSSSGSSSGDSGSEKPANAAPKVNLKSYAEKLAKNNEKFDALNKSAEVKQKEKDKEDDKEEGKEDGKEDDDDAVFTKEKVADFAKENYNDWVGEAFELIAFLKGAAEGEEVDWEKFGVETAKKVIYAFATYLGYGDITKTVIEGLESLLTSGEEPLSEMEKLTDMLDQEFNGMNDKLYEIEDQLGSVSNQITASVNDILGGTQSQIDNLEAKEILRKFMSSGEGNFSYNEFTNYLYGNNNSSSRSNEAYYNFLMRAIYNGESDDVIKYYYDKLFESLYTNITIYSEYYFGNVAGLDQSVVCYYYDYLVANPSLVPEGSTAEYEAIQFAFDLYTTYVYAYNLMNMCFAYQITDINLASFAKGQMNVSDTAYYSYTATDRITYGNIKAEIENMEQYINDAEAQMMKNVAYIMGMSDSYIALDKDGYYHEVLNNTTTYGNVVDGQIIYLNVLSDELLELFSVDRSNFEYYINGVRVLNSAEIATIDVSNIEGDSFVATVKYFGVEIYSIVFNKNVEDDFAGGNGTENDPYLIANLSQFLMVADNMNAHYKLIDDICVDGYINTMGSVENPFTGSFDGNGHVIEKLTIYSLEKDEENITMTPATGFFGVISSSATVKNLTLRDVKVRALEEEDGIGLESDRSYFYVGVIAGINEGVIINCTVDGKSSLTTDRSKGADKNRSLDVCVGGIAGSNNGVIGYCTVDGLAISADTSEFEFGGNSPAVNKNALYAGGIAGRSSGNISYSRVGAKTSVKTNAAAVANTSDRVTPYLTSYAGGIVGDPDAKDRLTSVYSECTKVVAGGYVYNEGTYWGFHRYNHDNENVLQGCYYPAYTGYDPDEELCTEWEKKLYEGIYSNSVTKYSDQYGYIPDIYLEVASKEAKQEIIKQCDKTIPEKEAQSHEGVSIAASYNDSCFTYAEPEYVTLLINAKTEYMPGSAFIDLKQLTVIDLSGNVLDVEFVGCYGFDSTNPSLTETKEITVKVFYVVEYEGDTLLKQEDLTITIGENRIVGSEILGFMEAPLNIGASTEEALDLIFTDGFDIVYYYANGEKDICSILRSVEGDNSSDVTITGIDTSAIGKITITVIHGETEISIRVNVSCSHPSGMKFDSSVDANCKFMGYDVYKCEDCGFEIHKNYHTGTHTYVVVDGVDATCHEPGYTQSVKCSVCDTVFESSEWIQALPHDYITIDKAIETVLDFVNNELYVNKDYHYCVNGDHYEPHQYVVTESSSTEGKMIYIYTCVTCGYVSEVIDDNITTDASGDIPVVFITDGYVVNVGDEVVVYVQILNNPGFNGANFGIRYTDGLELLSFEESTIVPAQLRVNNEVYNGYNFLWASGSGDSEGDGYLLKLTFKYVAENGEKQTIDVVYGMQEEQDDYGDTVNNLGGFTSSTDKNVISRFMTHSGTVTLVDHLPGDVNGDNVVDIMDATIIAWSIVGKTDSQGNKITVEKRYADVNLDGKVDLNDVISSLQSVSGRYGTNLLNSEYKLILNLAGYNNGDIETSFDIKFYNEDGKRTKWSDNIDFEAIKAHMNRLGYTFVGWYTRLEGGTLVDISGNISFDDMQGTQTLYARWEKNKVIFDMSGSNGEAFEDVIYTDAEPTLTPDTPEWSYNVEYIVENYGIYGDSSYKLYKDFLGWYIGDTLVSMYDLSTPNIGTVTLVAKWSDTYNWQQPTETRRGYADITKWYYKQAYNSNYLISEIDDSVIAELAKSDYTIYGQQNIIKYTITYQDLKGATNVNNDYFYVTSDFALVNLESVTGYDFGGWYDNLGNKVVKVQDTVGNMTLVAKWNPKIYEITVKGTDVNSFTTSGTSVIYSATDRNLFTLYYKYGVGYYLEPACTNALPTQYFASYCATQPGYSNYYIDGLYTSPITNNAHSNASIDAAKLVVGANTASHKMPELSEANRNGTLYAKLLPNKYTITFNHSSHNLLDNTFVSATWSGETLKIDYNASNGNYTLTNISPDDPHTGLNQWLTLEAGVTYMMHMDVASTTGTNSVQVFYAIDGAYAEANSLHFHGSQTYTFTVPTTGKYLIRVDNDCGGTATISNFWVSESRTEKLDVYYNESPGNISIPTSVFYNFAGYKYSGSVNYFDANGAPKQPYAISGNATFDAQWTQKYTGTYIKTQEEFRNIKNNTSGTYYLVCDIDLLKEHFTPLDNFNGTIDGLGHTLYGLSYEFIGSSGDYTNFGMFRQFSGNMRNLTIYAPYVYSEKSKDGQDNDSTGIIAGKMNGGTISNVSIIGAYVYGSHHRDVTASGTFSNAYVGGFVGYMVGGTISNCSISNSEIRSKASGPLNRADGHAFAGGIVGYMTAGTVSGCTRSDNTLVNARGEQNSGEKTPNSAIRAAAGGLVGSRDGGTVRGTSSANNLVSSIKTGKDASNYSWARKEAIVGTGGQG